MKNLNIIKKNNFSKIIDYKVNRSNTWGYTVSIKDVWTDKKLSFAGGCGYNKDAALLKHFIYNNYITEGNEYLKILMRRIDSGMIGSIFDFLSEENLTEFFRYLNQEVSCYTINKGKYKIIRIQLLNQLMSDDDFLNMQINIIENNKHLNY